MKNKKRKLTAFLLTAVMTLSLLSGGLKALASSADSTDTQSGDISDTQNTEVPDTQDSEIPDTQDNKTLDTQDNKTLDTQDGEISNGQDSEASGGQNGETPDGQNNEIPDGRRNSVMNIQNEVTFETTQDYVHNIYANGQPLLIVASESDAMYAELYIDSNHNGIGEAGEEIVNFRGNGTLEGSGIFYSEPNGGYFLTNSIIYGGSKDGNCQYDTSVTLSGGSGNTNRTVRLLFGGNENGTLTGNTNVTIAGGCSGWVYGGCRNGTLKGSTNVHITGGRTLCNIYGGNLSGQVNGNANVLMEGGEAFYVFGGGGETFEKSGGEQVDFFFGDSEEASIINGTASVTVNGGSVFTLFASGAGYTGGTAKVETAKIHLNGGAVSTFSACPDNQNMNGAVGTLSLELSGDSFTNTGFFFGMEENPILLKNVIVSLKNATISSLSFWSPIEEVLSVSFENSYATRILLADDVLKNTQNSSLSFTNCGQADGDWNTNPGLTVSLFNKNQFGTITFKDSYINYFDDTDTDGENGPSFCSKKLVLDGGALRVIGTNGNVVSYMPKTEFVNNPLLIRTAYHEGLNFAEKPDGTARIQWMNRNGSDNSDSMENEIFAETPSDTPDTLFIPADSGHVLKTESVMRGDSSGERWRGKAWYIGTDTGFCKCQAYSASLEENVFPLTEGSTHITAILKPRADSTANPASGCPVVGHKDSETSFSYTVIPDGTTAPGASAPASPR